MKARLRRSVLFCLAVGVVAAAAVSSVRLTTAGRARTATATLAWPLSESSLRSAALGRPSSGAPLLTASRPRVAQRVATPTYTQGALGFGPATVVDYQRTEGEPLGHIAPTDGAYWESGPWGFSTAQSFVHRSVDDGDQFNVVSPIDLRPNAPPGGGDSTIVTDDQGNTYFADLEALADIECSVSWDKGNNWVKAADCVHTTATDRQWLAVDNGATTGAADNTVFLGYHEVDVGHYLLSSPGSTGTGDLTGGLVYQNAIGTGLPTDKLYGGSGNCAQLVFDPQSRNLYYACGGAGGNGTNCPSGPTGPVGGRRVDVTIVHVPPGQRTGLTAVTKALPNTPMCLSNLFPVITVDTAGNVYVVWSDTGDHNIYYSYSTDQGNTWSAPIRVNNPAAPATTTAFAWSQAGAPGTLAAIYLQAASDKVSDVMPNWNQDPQGSPPGGPALAAQYKWYGEVSFITNANTTSPTINDNKFSEKPTHYGQICNSGIGCTVTFGDRTMADFLSVAIDTNGALRIVYNDTTSQYHGAHLYETRQLSGPTLTGVVLGPLPSPPNPMPDPAGDAQWPHYSPAGAGPNQPQLDLRSVAVNQQTANTLRFRMTLNNLGGATGFLPPPGKANAFAIVRFQALSRDDTNTAEAYRIFYVGVESVGGTGTVAPVFFAGSPTRDGPPNGTVVGCNTTTPGNCKVVQYPPEFPLTSGTQISGNTICIDVPLDGFGVNRPINGTTLYNVSGFTGGRDNSVDDIYADVDSTRGFDFALGTVSTQPCASPTAVKLTSFVARQMRSGVLVSWRTGAESEALGFNVYRGSLKLNRSLIAARGSATGATYRFVDRTVGRAGSHTYRLQVVGRSGERRWAATTRT